MSKGFSAHIVDERSTLPGRTGLDGALKFCFFHYAARLEAYTIHAMQPGQVHIVSHRQYPFVGLAQKRFRSAWRQQVTGGSQRGTPVTVDVTAAHGGQFSADTAAREAPWVGT